MELSADRGEGDARRFFSAKAFEDQKRVRHRGERYVMMPARPRAPLEVIEPQLVLELAVILLDPPAPLGQPDEAAETEVFAAQIGEPVRGGGGGV